MKGTTMAEITANGNAMAGGIGSATGATIEDASVTGAAEEEAVAITGMTDAAHAQETGRLGNAETSTTLGMGAAAAAEMDTDSADAHTPASATPAARLESRPAHVRSINHINYNYNATTIELLKTTANEYS